MMAMSVSDSLKNGKLRQIWFALRVNTDSHRMSQLEVGVYRKYLLANLRLTVPFLTHEYID